MITRLIGEKILRDLAWSPIIGIVGSRQVGKTTLAKSLQDLIGKPTLYLDLELTEDWAKLQDAQAYLSGHADKCIIIDEVQVRPELFALLRALVDQNRVPARFILLGSAAPHIVKQNTETLAGRITYHELSPFSLSEIKDTHSQNEHWFRGGFPGSLLATESFISRKWLEDFTETFIHRDLQRLGFSVQAGMLKNMISMLAHLHGQQLNVSMLANSLGVSAAIINKHLDLLEGSFVIRRLQPYFVNVGKRLTKSPKCYIRDSGLVHHLLRVADLEQLYGNPAIGASWEGYVIEQIIREAPAFSDFYYYRTQHGAEIDLLMITPKGKKVCLEIKFSVAPTLSRGFFEATEDVKADFKYIITPSGERYNKANGLVVCPLQVFLEQELGIFDL
jgi:uncharacterized protein